jgi:site-specific recombinase XerC
VLAVALLGAERERALTAYKSLKRVPASAATVRILLDRAGAILQPFEAARFCAMIIMAYMGVLRMGDILPQTAVSFDPKLHLCTTSVTTTVQFLPSRDATIVHVDIQSSKTDRKRKGRVVDIMDQPGGMSLRDATAAWLAQREAQAQPDWSPAMFVTARGVPVSTRSFRVELAKVTTAIETLPGGILPHSFRKGAATVLKAHDYSDSTVAAAGRWASNCFLDYISPVAEKQDEMFATLATSAY